MHENAILCSAARPPLELDHKLQEVYHHLNDADHGWSYTHMLLDITHEEVDSRTHRIIHPEHHMET
jgi:hypothetical protein